MNLRNLQYFCAAYEAGSTVGAARACHVTQPAVSAAIASLEAELGVLLFVRGQRALSPTPAGIRLFRLGGKLLADAQAIVETFQEVSERPRLAVYAHPSIGVAKLRDWLIWLRQHIDHLELSVLDEPEQADVRLMPESCVTAGEMFHPLWSESYALLVPCEHPLAVQPDLSLADLHGVAFVERTQCELASHWQAGLQTLQIAPDVRARVHSHEWALALVAAGVGVTLAPIAPNDALQSITVRADLPELQSVQRTVGVLCAAGSESELYSRVVALSRAWAGSTMAALLRAGL